MSMTEQWILAILGAVAFCYLVIAVIIGEWELRYYSEKAIKKRKDKRDTNRGKKK